MNDSNVVRFPFRPEYKFTMEFSYTRDGKWFADPIDRADWDMEIPDALAQYVEALHDTYIRVQRASETISSTEKGRIVAVATFYEKYTKLTLADEVSPEWLLKRADHLSKIAEDIK